MTTEPTRGSRPDEAKRWEILARYLSGESSAAETAHVRDWLADDPRRSELLDALQRVTGSVALPPDLAGIDVEAALRRASAQLEAPGVQDGAAFALPARRRTVWTGGFARAAALAVLLLGAAAVVWQVTREDEASRATAVTGRVFTAPVGLIDSVRLSDGTRVLLAPGSRLSVDAGYSRVAYQVELSGEALFDVAPAAAGRFTVRAGPTVIRDLGTTFAVRTDVVQVRVVVTAGAVVMRVAAEADSGAVLRAGDRAVLSQSREINVERGSASRDDLAWTDGRLVFDNATLAHVAEELRRWYGITLQFADPALADRHFTARFEGEDASHVLDVLALALDVEIVRRGNTALVRQRS